MGMTEEEKAVWIEIVNDCNSPQKSVNVGTQKRRNVINAVNKALMDSGMKSSGKRST